MLELLDRCKILTEMIAMRKVREAAQSHNNVVSERPYNYNTDKR